MSAGRFDPSVPYLQQREREWKWIREREKREEWEEWEREERERQRGEK